MKQVFDKIEHSPEGMLAESSYSASGFRNYFQKPILPYKRNCWEFQAILSGHCFPTDAMGNPQNGPTSSVLWLFSPDCIHGWSAQDYKGCEVVVFHFNYIPTIVQNLIKDRPKLYVDLDALNKEAIKREYQQTRESILSDLPCHNQLAFAHSNIQLCNFILQSSSKPSPNMISLPKQKVNQAIALYHQELVSNPSVEEISRKLNMSPTHLRRHFRSVLGKSPKEVFLKIQLDAVKRTLQFSQLSINEISSLFSFSEPAALSRAIQKFYNKTPSRLRREAK